MSLSARDDSDEDFLRCAGIGRFVQLEGAAFMIGTVLCLRIPSNAEEDVGVLRSTGGGGELCLEVLPLVGLIGSGLLDLEPPLPRNSCCSFLFFGVCFAVVLPAMNTNKIPGVTCSPSFFSKRSFSCSSSSVVISSPSLSESEKAFNISGNAEAGMAGSSPSFMCDWG